MNEIKFFLDYDESEDGVTIQDKIETYLETNNICEAKKLIIGAWEEPFDCGPEDIIKYLVENKNKFPNVESMYIGDMDSEECEVSWITQSNLAPLLDVFPLKTLKIKGSIDLRLENANSETLEKLIIISGGLGKNLLKDIVDAKFPNLMHLELYLGVDDYGFDGDMDDIIPFMIRENFPNVKYLGLKNSEKQDEICEEIFKSNILENLEVLDMSLGTLGDKGAELILENVGKIAHLSKLDLTYNYISDENIEKLQNKVNVLSTEVLIDRDDADYDEDDEWRYPYITE